MQYTFGDRSFTLKEPTNRERIKAFELAGVTATYDKALQMDPDRLNEFMRTVLSGDHDGIDWLDAKTNLTDGIIKDFFTSLTPKESE